MRTSTANRGLVMIAVWTVTSGKCKRVALCANGKLARMIQRF